MTAAAIRASDADRDRVTHQLQAACAAGTLTAHELEDRIDKALLAAHVSELDDLVRDLPTDRLPARPCLAPVARFAGILALLSVACIGLWLVGGAHGSFWPKWVLLASAARLAAYASHQRSDHAGDTTPLWLVGPLGLVLAHLPLAGRPRGRSSATSNNAKYPMDSRRP
jgi:hypothetical protein